MADLNTPDSTSSDYREMLPYWQKVTDVVNGADAMRKAGEKYLPRFSSEDDTAYGLRRDRARFTNIYLDISENLADRPFSKEVKLAEKSDRVEALTEDIDGQGNNLHNFAKGWFGRAIDYAIDWVYVDYTRTNPITIDASGVARRKTIAEERVSGARPYWVHVPATEMIAVYSSVLNGVEVFTHCRMLEVYKERAGWEEVEVVQVRELTREPIYDADDNIIDFYPAEFRVWRQVNQNAGTRKPQKLVWEVVDEGPIAIGVIPIVPLILGERKGSGWTFIPPLKSILELQFEYYEAENGLKNIKQLTAYPMLTANGVMPQLGADGKPVKAPVGPRAVLYGGYSEAGQGSWEFIEPAGSSLTFLQGDLKELAKEMRELGRQPLTQQTAQLTTTTTQAAVGKSLVQIQSWALAMKDAMENALFLTALWLNDAIEPTVSVDLDFDVSAGNAQTFSEVREMRKAGDLSQRTLWREAQRRKILSDEFDPEDEEDAILEEAPEDPGLDDTEALETGDPSPITE